MQSVESSQEPDEELARRAAGGRREDFALLYERYVRPVHSLVARMTGDPDRARDLTQDIFGRALASIRSYDPARKFSSWLFKIATHRVVDHLHDRKRWEAVDVADEPSDSAPRPEVVLAHREDAERVRAALPRVPEELRLVLLLSFQEQMSHAEIAETLSITVNLARVRLFRGLRRLEEELTR